MSSPFATHGRALSADSDAAYSVRGQLDDNGWFPSELAPLQALNTTSFDPSNYPKSDSRDLIRKTGDDWDDIQTMLNGNTPDPSVMSNEGAAPDLSGPGRAVAASHLMSGDSILPASTTPYTLFPPPSHGSAFDGSSSETRSTPINGPASSPTDYQVWEHLKSLLEGYLSGDKLSFEKEYDFGQKESALKAQRALLEESVSASAKLRWNVPGQRTPHYCIVGLIDTTLAVFKKALNVNLQLLDCLVLTGEKQKLSRLQRRCYCTKARLTELWRNCRGGDEFQIYNCVCKGHADIEAIAISPMDGALEMQKTFEECREYLSKALAIQSWQVGSRHVR